MVQVDIDSEFRAGLVSVKAICMEYLSKCWSCRNDREHMKNHIQAQYKWANSESIRRMAQKIQNTEGLYPADKETQMIRSAKQNFMEKNIKGI